MDCTIPRSEFLGEETFIGPDNCEYNKVKITSNWNQLSISLYDLATATELHNKIFTIPEGEYDHNSLQASIMNYFTLFHYEKTGEHLFRVGCNEFTITYPWLEEREQGETWSANFRRAYGNELNDIIDMGFFEDIQDLDYYQDYFFIDYIDVNNDFEYPNYEYVVTVIKQCENGIDKILPFTCPIRTFNNLETPETHMEISSYMSHKFDRDESPHKFIYNCGLSPVFFKLYWLNENFFASTNPEYYDEDLILNLEMRCVNNSIYFNYGKYTKYGYCMSILYELLCEKCRNYDCSYNYIPVCNKDNTAIVYLIGCDSDYQITDANSFINLTKDTDHNLLYIDSTDENKNTSCDSCANCKKCVNCNYCNNCIDCYGCTNCTNCDRCSNCSNVY